MPVTKKELINYFSKENEIFSFEEFFTDSSKDKRAIIVITPNQIIKTRNILDNDNERSGHDITYDYLTRVLYNIIFDENGVMLFDEKEMEDNKDAINYLQYYQNIMIRMCNEGVNNSKLVWIHIPPKVTTSQLEMLKELNYETNTLFKKISKTIKNNEDEYLVAFNDYHDEVIYGDSLDIVINYIMNNNLIEDNEPIIEENCIIGENNEDVKIMDKQI